MLFGIKPFILKLNKLGYRQFILSASSDTILKKSINHYNFSSLFVKAYGVDNLNATGKTVVGKQLCKSHKLNINETVLIGDTEYDKRVADELGCPAPRVAAECLVAGVLSRDLTFPQTPRQFKESRTLSIFARLSCIALRGSLDLLVK